MSFFDQSQIERDCDVAHREIRWAFSRARNSHLISFNDRRLLDEGRGGELFAVNNFSRIAVGRALCEEFARHLGCNDEHEHDQPLFFLTLIFRNGVQPLGSDQFDLGSPRRLMQRDLGKLNYIGAIEPALHLSLPARKTGLRQAISWHAHLLLWGLGHDAVGHLVHRLRKTGRYRTVDGRVPAAIHVRQVNNGELPRTTAYLIKPPANGYRLICYERSTDGQLHRDARGKPRPFIKQKKSRLRPGQRLTLFRALKGFRLDELIIAGGAGSRLRTSAIRTAHRFLQEYESAWVM